MSLEGKDSINVLDAFITEPVKPLRSELSPGRSDKHVAYRRGKWLYIPAQGSGGFKGAKPNQHAWGGPAAVALVGGENSDIENGRFKKNAPKTQLYDMESDPNQTVNVVNKHPEVAAEMKRELRAKLKKLK